jgi:hypothetical protein
VKRKREKDISAIFAKGTAIDRALAAAAWDAVRRHREAGVPLVLWRNGRIVRVRAEELLAARARRARKR